MRLQEQPRVVADPSVVKQMRDTAMQVNALADGRITAHDTAQIAAPTAGAWRQGDFVRNSAPVEAGSAASKYMVIGWTCTVSGTPGTWLPNRTLTGN